MPTYEYVCQQCEKEFEVFQSMKDRALTKCPNGKCGGRVRRKLGLGAGLLFKGSGFYITDYRSQSYQKAAKAEASTTASSGSSEGGGESKPAVKDKTEKKPSPAKKSPSRSNPSES